MGASNSTAARSSSPGCGCPVVETSSSECPVPERYRNPAVYNVYSQRINTPSSTDEQNPLEFLKRRETINPSNNMPLEANQVPWPGQREPISTVRQQSSIPKGGTDTTWLFPSPQMFYNALKRKGKGDDVSESDMDAVVWAHNSMNQRTWQQVVVWEKLHRHACDNPTLLKFQGKPDDLSPLARMRSWLGGPLPFDRHDWIVDRCGQEVRYVIDFYYNEEKGGTSQAFDITVRPALDSMEAGLDRLKMAIYIGCARWGLPCPITGQAAVVGSAAVQGLQQQQEQSAQA